MEDVEKVSPSDHREIADQNHQSRFSSSFKSGKMWLKGIPTHKPANIAAHLGTNTGKSNVNIQWTLHKVLYKIDGHWKDSLLREMPLEEEHPSATRTCHTVRRQDIHRRRWRISPSDGTHFFDAGGEEND